MSPWKSKHPCSYPGCPKITADRFCEQHSKIGDRKYDEERGTASERGYDAQWQKVRIMKLNEDPLCEECLKKGIVVEAAVVHHIKPLETHPELRLMIDNLMSLCVMHHEQIHRLANELAR
jgi:5-methylcytosine-specific restriction protein A